MNECLGIVLAGGLSSRMGQDKAQLPYKETTMLNFSKQLLKRSGIKQVVVSGDQYQAPDLIKNAGPVGGIYSIVQQFKPTSMLILPVDLPLMEAGALKELRMKGELSQKACFFEGHHIPLYLPNNGYLTLFLSQNFNNLSPSIQVNEQQSNKKFGPSVKQLLMQVPNVSIKTKNSTLLFNTNTPEQWQKAINMK